MDDQDIWDILWTHPAVFHMKEYDVDGDQINSTDFTGVVQDQPKWRRIRETPISRSEPCKITTVYTYTTVIYIPKKARQIVVPSSESSANFLDATSGLISVSSTSDLASHTIDYSLPREQVGRWNSMHPCREVGYIYGASTTTNDVTVGNTTGKRLVTTFDNVPDVIAFLSMDHCYTMSVSRVSESDVNRMLILQNSLMLE